MEKLAHYQILEKLGSGGMGEVYRAEDTRLGRSVAIKVLLPDLIPDEDRRQRFFREARTASALNHPNIVTIYEVNSSEGVDFIAMEYVRGRTLQTVMREARLSGEQVLEFGVQIAEALTAAHSAGVIHRDLKPANIMVNDRGLIKVLDFGLAKFVAANDAERSDATVTMLQQTQPGMILGTCAYMSPEQARGLTLDARSDLFSFGAVLYEMAAGKAPFEGPTSVSVLLALVDSSPDYSAVPMELRNPVSRLLEKDRDLRYQSAAELAADLRGLAQRENSVHSTAGSGAQTAAHPTAIAVLPFANLSPDPDNEYFSDGLTDEIINALTHIPGLRVVGRTSAFQFKGLAQNVATIGQQLKVDVVLEGSVRWVGDRLRVNAQLIGVAEGYHLWSDSYDRRVKDVFDVQEEISRSIMEALQLRFSERGSAVGLRPYNLDLQAYNLYLRGNFNWTKQNLKKAIECFEEALTRDPRYAPACVGLANCYLMLAHTMPAREMLSKAKEMALRALAIDRALAEAHTALGMVHALYDFNWEDAAERFQSAVRLNPGSSQAHSGFAIGYLAPVGRLAEAIKEMELAQEIDPLSPFVSHTLGTCLYFDAQYERALEQGRKTIDLDERSALAHLLIGRIGAARGEFDDALGSFKAAMELEPSLSLAAAAVGLCYGALGRMAEAQNIAETLTIDAARGYVSPYAIALAHLGAGAQETGMEWLDKAIDDRAGGVQFLAVEPLLNSYRSHSAFPGIIRKLGFPPRGV